MLPEQASKQDINCIGAYRIHRVVCRQVALTSNFRGHRPARPVRDHARENILAIREQQQQRKKEGPVPEKKKALPKLKQFENVPSRVLSSPPAATEKREYLRRGARDEAPKPVDVHASRVAAAKKQLGRGPERDEPRPEVATPRKEGLPREKARLKPREAVDFVRRNREAAASVVEAAPATPPERAERAKHDDFGTVPAYLAQRKAELRREAEERRASLPDPDAPPGMVRMDDAERRSMLETLETQHKSLQAELDKFPLAVTTLRMTKRKEDLEARLAELDKSLAVFSKPVVYVKA
ncbi:hypothetical protein CTAYLR_001932 [Chrysophaeum taylorii]|uniref:Enkurin domain-containing protein n=1 Tax=Chrysophaeum taylorii TaxID=2483200 RepID=A0AAD7UAS9_9STRA|nr:hypothetical protein CTAYLR_001932 [Chrysophaeum taylorii]